MVYLFEEYELDDQNFCLTHHGRRVPLEPKSLSVLLLLVSGRCRLVQKSAILEAVWKETFVEEATLTRAIALIRKQLGDDSRSPRFIETVPTLGYRFMAHVQAATEEIPTPVGMQQEHAESSAAEAEPTGNQPEPPDRPLPEKTPVPTRSALRSALL